MNVTRNDLPKTMCHCNWSVFSPSFLTHYNIVTPDHATNPPSNSPGNMSLYLHKTMTCHNPFFTANRQKSSLIYISCIVASKQSFLILQTAPLKAFIQLEVQSKRLKYKCYILLCVVSALTTIHHLSVTNIIKRSPAEKTRSVGYSKACVVSKSEVHRPSRSKLSNCTRQ